MKKILFVLNTMNIGGTEKAFLNQLEVFSPDQYDITLFLLEKNGGFMEYVPSWVHIETMEGYSEIKPEVMKPPFQVIRDLIKKRKFIHAIDLLISHIWFKISGDRTFYFKRILKNKKNKKMYDIAISYAGPFDFLTVYVLYFVKAKRKIQWIHFDVSKIYFNVKMCKRLYDKFDQINVVSEEAREELIKKIPQIENKTFTYRNNISEKQCKRMATLGKGFDDNFDGVRIITVGRLSKEKGQDIIPEIAKKLKREGIHFKWYLVGEGNLKPYVENKCKEYNVKDEIVFLGANPNPYQYLRDADIYVQTSLYEGFCITLAEAKVFNLPIVSTDCAGAHEQLDECDNCYVVERDEEQITTAILQLLKLKI